MPELINLPTESYIALGALIISIISLIIAYRNQQTTKRLTGEEKKTANLIKILETKHKLRESLDKIKIVKVLCDKCSKSQGDKLLQDANSCIKKIDELYAKFEKIDFFNPIDWEKYMPEFYALLLEAEQGLNSAEALLKFAESCKSK